MYRLMIADDEALEREGLEWIVRQRMPGIFQIIHADNGRAAIALAEEHRPHIIMMDVNMPGIQGLEAIREIKSQLPDTKFVLVTAYDYFAYAKEALSLGVKEYIVKPAKRDQIVSLLEQLVQEVEQEKQKRADELELRHKVSQLDPMLENELALMLMVDQIADTDAEQLSEWLEFPLDHGGAMVVAFPTDSSATDKKKLFDSVRSYAKACGLPCIVSSLIDLHMTIFLRRRPDGSESAWTQRVQELGEKLSQLAERQHGMTVSIGIGSAGRGITGLRTSYYEAVFASTCYAQGGSVCSFGELEGAEAAAVPPSAAASTFGGEHRSYVTAALHRIREEREQQTVTVLDRARNYILQHYTDELSLEEVADHVHLNAHYFSKIFKQQFGDTFIDFVTKLRIDKAKSLIIEGHLSLKEVCFEVGYKDPNYFSRVFKKVTGVTPTDYRVQSSN